MSTDEAEPLTDAADAVAEHADAATERLDAITEPPPAPFSAAGPTAAGEPRPELLVGGAFLGGMILAKLLGRRRAR